MKKNEDEEQFLYLSGFQCCEIRCMNVFIYVCESGKAIENSCKNNKQFFQQKWAMSRLIDIYASMHEGQWENELWSNNLYVDL